MPPEIFLKGEGVIALTSDASIDFTPVDFDSPLTDKQRGYLQSVCGMDIPQVFWRKQIHGDNILIARGTVHSVGGAPDADAFISQKLNRVTPKTAAGAGNQNSHKQANAFINREKLLFASGRMHP